MCGRVLGRDGTFMACPVGGFIRLRAAWGGRIYNSPMQLVSRKSWVWVRRQDAKKGKECHWELWELRNTYDVSWSYISFKIETFDLLPWKIYFSMTSEKRRAVGISLCTGATWEWSFQAKDLESPAEAGSLWVLYSPLQLSPVAHLVPGQLTGEALTPLTTLNRGKDAHSLWVHTWPV